jgi:hypothetical protein
LYDLLTCVWSEAGNGQCTGRRDDLGEMKWCRRSTGATTSSAVTNRIRLSEFYNNFFIPPLSYGDGKGQVLSDVIIILTYIRG